MSEKPYTREEFFKKLIENLPPEMRAAVEEISRLQKQLDEVNALLDKLKEYQAFSGLCDNVKRVTNLGKFQQDVRDWQLAVFPEVTGTGQLLGLAEEVGELIGAWKHGLTPEARSSEAADILIYLVGYCAQTSIDLPETAATKFAGEHLLRDAANASARVSVILAGRTTWTRPA
jgi:hypothetical protein